MIKILAGAHPLPDRSSVTSGRRILNQVRSAESRTLILAVVTGGASATLEVPAEGISLADLRETTTALLESGAGIHEINAVRRYVSTVKGGDLATAAAPATTVGLLFSDVIGNDPSVIGRGPTVPDKSAYEDALTVVSRYAIDLPPSVRNHLEAGRVGHQAETPGREDDVFDCVSNVVLVRGLRRA